MDSLLNRGSPPQARKPIQRNDCTYPPEACSQSGCRIAATEHFDGWVRECGAADGAVVFVSRVSAASGRVLAGGFRRHWCAALPKGVDRHDPRLFLRPLPYVSQQLFVYKLLFAVNAFIENASYRLGADRCAFQPLTGAVFTLCEKPLTSSEPRARFLVDLFPVGEWSIGVFTEDPSGRPECWTMDCTERQMELYHSKHNPGPINSWLMPPAETAVLSILYEAPNESLWFWLENTHVQMVVRGVRPSARSQLLISLNIRRGAVCVLPTEPLTRTEMRAREEEYQQIYSRRRPMPNRPPPTSTIPPANRPPPPSTIPPRNRAPPPPGYVIRISPA